MISGAEQQIKRRLQVTVTKTRIVIALDCDRASEVERILKVTGDRVSFYKVGSILFTSLGPKAIDMVRCAEKHVFLDLKFHDIPNTVMGAVRAACSWGVNMLTVHCSGGHEMLLAALRGADEGANIHGSQRPMVIGVTVLTSLAGRGDVVSRVLDLSKTALDAGIDGVVCSPMEVASVKQVHGSRLVAVVPGIRLGDQGQDDQARVATPSRAAKDGADFIVVGRSVTQSKNPDGALESILKEVGDAQGGRRF
jgi:orotidine-5'-phosphate decarboxylase